MRKKLPEWIKRGIIDTESTRTVRKILKERSLNTVCESARCPNKGECFSQKTATFLIMGDVCTRNCKFCGVKKGMPQPVSQNEPESIAEAVVKLELDYIVITSVTRDDLKDGGAAHFAKVISALKNIKKDLKVEVLTPDFQGDYHALSVVLDASPDVFNHNIETVKRLYPEVRNMADYQRSLNLIAYSKRNYPHIHTKSGFMAGLGESFEEIKELLADLHHHNCDIITAGQYIQPTALSREVSRYLTPEEFEEINKAAISTGIKQAFCSPLARSSYRAGELAGKNL